MKIITQGALLAGASPLALQAPETKDDNLTVEVKKAVDDLAKVFEDFKKKNDERLAQAEKKGEDAVTKDEVEKINSAIDTKTADLRKLLDEISAKQNRLALGGGAGADPELKAAQAFGELVKKSDFSVENLREYKAALADMLRKNEVKATTLQVGSDPAGGYLVTPDTSGRMVKKINESTPMRQLASIVPIGTDALEGVRDNDDLDAGWVGEQQTRSQTDGNTLGTWRIPVHELYAYPKVTQKLLEDASIDIEAWVGNSAAGKFARKEAAAFVSGDGINKPRGFLSYDTPVTTADATRAWGALQYVASGASGAFASSNPADKLVDLIFELKAAYRQNASFLMARRTMGAVRKLKDGQGNYLVDLRLRDGALVESIFGFPTFDGEDMPAIAANSFSIAFGDFAEAYMIVERLGITVVRDNITAPGFVKYNFRKRVGGGLINFEALKLMKFATS